MAFQPGNKLSPGRPKGSVKKKAVKQLADSMAVDNFNIYEHLLKLLETCKDDAVRLRALQFMAQYTQQPLKHDETTDEESEPQNTDLDALVTNLKSV